MTKSELIERFAKRYPHLVMQDAQVVVQTILDDMCNSLMVGERVEIRGFGVFHLRYRLPRDGRNPKSWEVVKVPAKYVPHFKAGKELRERARTKSARRR
jgi:integration host factor subunit beta